MIERPVFILGAAAATAFGTTLRANCDALFAGRTAFACPRHFDAKGRVLGIDPELDNGPGGSRSERLLLKLRDAVDFTIPMGTHLFAATTVGAIDRLEAGETVDTAREFLHTAERVFGCDGGTLVSAACASGQTAVALAMRQLRQGAIRRALVVGGDVASEFVTSGFAALGALSHSVCRPYDAGRDGLTLGEGAAALLLGCDGPGIGMIAGAAETCDAAHITSPDLSGRMLAAACRAALGDTVPSGVIGHGTGTIYNDQSEVAALHTLFPSGMPPLFSLKGNYGHTLGATGVLQIALGLEFSRNRQLPPQVGLVSPMEHANTAAAPRTLDGGRLLSLNVGFGGLNSAVVLEAL
jgi:3-oxoacyl-(acyl-carrier-protein) synthase